MKKRINKALSVLLIFMLSIGILSVPSLAAEDSPVSSTGTIWSDWASSMPDFFGKVFSVVVGQFGGEVCPNSDDHLHHGKVIAKNLLGNGKWQALCDYCGEKFVVYDDDMQNAYNEHVNKVQETLGTVQVGTDGIYIIPALDWSNFTWGPNEHWVNFNSGSFSFSYSPDGLSVNMVSEFYKLPSKWNLYVNGSLIYPSIVFGSGTLYTISKGYVVSFSCPSATLSSNNNSGLTYIKKSGSTFTDEIPGIGSSEYLLSGWQFSSGSSFYFSVCGAGNVFSADAILSLPVLRFVPDSWSINDYTSPVGGSGSRVGSISGNFGYYVNGDLVTVDNTTIVNETTNTYTNPETGTTSPITNWTYDYSDRSYNLTLESGDTVSVTYGDENVTINEGDKTYNIYYIIQGSGGGDTPTPSPGPSACPHNYTSEITTEPTCISSGVETFTCSICGDTYTKIVPAAGHKWIVDRTVNTEYDESGYIVREGYTIWVCSVCGEQYKDTDGSGPPSGGGSSGGESGGGFLDWLLGKLGEIFGSIGEGILSLLQNALGKVLDGIISIINMLTEKLNTVLDSLFKVFDEVPAMFSGFTEFLTAMFAFIPPEIITILVFGILAIVLVAIFKIITR